MADTNGTSNNGNTSTDTSTNTSISSAATEVDELLDFLANDSDAKGGEVNNKTTRHGSDIGSNSSSNAAVDGSLSSRTSPPYSSVKESNDEVDEGEYSPREKKLLERIEALTQEKLESSKKSTEVVEDNFNPQEHNFLDGLDIDEVLSSSDNLNKLLLGVYNKALQESSKLSAENIMRSLPSTMSNYVTQHLTMREMVNNFYDDNDDLVGAKQTVTDVANKIANENPDLSVEEVFAKTADEARKVLNLKRIEPKNKSKPTLHNSRGNGGRARLNIPELDGLAKEVNDLISD